VNGVKQSVNLAGVSTNITVNTFFIDFTDNVSFHFVCINDTQAKRTTFVIYSCKISAKSKLVEVKKQRGNL
jgi:hypothetical protein